MGLSSVVVVSENGLIALNACSKSESFIACRDCVNHCRACLANDLVLGIRASRNTDCANDRAILNQRNTAARGNNSVKCEQVVQVHKVDTVFEYLGWAPEGRGCPCLVLRNLNGRKH